MIPYSWLEQAAERIAPHVKKTPIIRDAENQIYLKLENQQECGLILQQEKSTGQAQ